MSAQVDRPYRRPPATGWRRSNESEAGLQELGEYAGWLVTKRGWPDFICTNPKTGERIAVEVKPKYHGREGMKPLKRAQADCMDWLEAHGIRCFLSDGERLYRYNRAKHFRERPPRQKDAGRSPP